MKESFKRKSIRLTVIIITVLGICSLIIFGNKKYFSGQKFKGTEKGVSVSASGVLSEEGSANTDIKNDSRPMPVYGNWKNFTIKDGLPSDHAYAVRIDGDRVLVGTHEGLAVYEKGVWQTYTTKDGLAHNGVVSIDVSELTGMSGSELLVD